MTTSLLSVAELNARTRDLSKSERMPVLFVGHGNPMNVLWDNDFTRHLKSLSSRLARPNAILVVSAHWETRGTAVSVSTSPETIYDFGGFPDEMYRIKYPAPGAPEIARELSAHLKERHVQEDPSMGLDHGAWTILKHIYPKADIPVFQLSLDATQGPDYHYRLGAELQYLRSRGVLIIGSGNIVHNLRRINFDEHKAKAFDWAVEFDEIVKKKINQRDFSSLVNYEKLGSSAQLAVPSNEHYLPMLYTLACADAKDEIHMIFEGIQNSSISMRCFQIG